MMDLYNASREDLIRTILAQRKTIAQRQAVLARHQGELAAAHATAQQLAQRVGELVARVGELEERSGSGRPKGLAGNKLVVEARLKGSGMHWARDQVDPLVALRTVACAGPSGTAWPQTAAEVRAQAAARPAPRSPTRGVTCSWPTDGHARLRV
jgi:hypothetical protein